MGGPWVEPFIYLVCEYYKKYKKFGLKEPASVKKCAQEYKSESDIFAQFFSEKIIEDEDGVKNQSGLMISTSYFKNGSDKHVVQVSRFHSQKNLVMP